MITYHTINGRIQQLKNELAILGDAHDRMVQNFQQQVQANQLRFQRLQAAITELTLLLKNEKPPDTGNDGLLTDRFLSHIRGVTSP